MKNVEHPFSPASVTLTPPHGGVLVPLMVAANERQQLMKEAAGLESLQISPASASHLAMLAGGAFSPVHRFLGEREYQSVTQSMRLSTGDLCPVPITLPAGNTHTFRPGSRIALRDVQNRLLACMTVEESFEVLHTEARHSRSGRIGNADHTWSERALSGPLQVFHIPADPQFPGMWKEPGAIRRELSLHGAKNVIAVDHWEPRDEANTGWLSAIARERDAVLLLNLAGAEQRVDALGHYQHLRECGDAYARFFITLQALLNFVHLESSLFSEQQILWHAIVHKNFGANSYVVDRSRWNGKHAVSGEYHPEQSKLLADSAAELGMELILRDTQNQTARRSFSAMNGSSVADAPQEISSKTPAALPATQNTFPSQATFHLPSEWGLCLWFTGLPCSGKSTIAEQLLVLLMEGGLRVTLLDGDTVRTHLSKGLTFSKEDRDTNVQRIGFVASEIVRHCGVVICAAVSPWRETRDNVRQMMPEGSFVEIFVDTPVEECERRDVKGFYARARAGKIDSFTGVNDPYEAPIQPEIVLQTEGTTEQENAELLLQFLVREHYLGGTSHA